MTAPMFGPGKRLRAGTQVHRTLYLHDGDDPKGVLVGMVDTPELAAHVVQAVNAWPWDAPVSEGRKVLDAPMDGRYPTTRDALVRVLRAFWFDDAVAVTSTTAIYRALNRAGLTDVTFDEWDLPVSGQEEADRLIRTAIAELGTVQPPGEQTPKETDQP
jgi:hypothetical protein